MKKIITHRKSVFLVRSRRDWTGTQYLVLDTLIFGRRFFTTIIDSEEVPAHALIERDCLGACFGWRSKFSSEIDEQQKRSRSEPATQS